MIRPVVIISALVVLLLLAAGCVTGPLGGESDHTYNGGSGEGGSVVAFTSSSPLNIPSATSERAGAPMPVAASVPNNAAGLPSDQKIIRTATVNLEVDNVTAGIDLLKAIAAGHNGYTGSLSVNTRGTDRLYAVMTIRVPAGDFDAAIGEIKGLGKLTSEQLSADDVTEEYVDLQARRAALASQLDQYNRIMLQAVNVSEILEVQVQIERVQVELDRIDGRLKYLDNRVEYATITVSLAEPEPVGGGEPFSFVSVINEGIAGFLAVAAGLVIILISVIPLLIVGAIVYWIYVWWKKRKEEKRKPPAEKEKSGEGQKPPGV